MSTDTSTPTAPTSPAAPSAGRRPPTLVWPALRYRDAGAAIRFLVEAFGFVEVVRYPGETEGQVAHAELAWPEGGGLMLGSARPDSVIAGVPAGTGSVYVVTRDPDGLFARATAAGATVLRGLTDEDYGSREFTVRDPEGVHWSFGTYAGAPVPPGDGSAS
jgi:uncharacterized glyoxalase superfamily protein PhnB